MDSTTKNIYLSLAFLINQKINSILFIKVSWLTRWSRFVVHLWPENMTWPDHILCIASLHDNILLATKYQYIALRREGQIQLQKWNDIDCDARIGVELHRGF